MLNSLQSRKCHEQYGKEDFAGVQETRTIGSGLRGHSDDQIRPLKPDNRPETTKENARWETSERQGFGNPPRVMGKGVCRCGCGLQSWNPLTLVVATLCCSFVIDLYSVLHKQSHNSTTMRALIKSSSL